MKKKSHDKARSRDDIGLDDQGKVIAIGDEARNSSDAIIDHPDAQPVLIIARLNDDMGIRVFGPPSLKIADRLDAIAAQYRQIVMIALKKGPKN